MANRLSGKTCIITGSGGSIGQASVLKFASEGAQIVGCDVNVERSRETVDLVRAAGGEMVSIEPCDLTDFESCQKLVDLAIGAFGKIDVLFNCGAMAYFDWIEDMAPETFRRCIEEELTLVFLLTKAAWPHLTARGNASIINVASLSAHEVSAVTPGIAHTAAKGAVLAMTRQLALEGSKHQIRANTISPGLILTHQTRPFMNRPEYSDIMKTTFMLGRPGEPDDIANCALYLASNESRYVTGIDIKVDGGMGAW
jgi:NAD(P)-dependent dehydrogenase (short-subunit alcohol dehydrogenase family)